MAVSVDSRTLGKERVFNQPILEEGFGQGSWRTCNLMFKVWESLMLITVVYLFLDMLLLMQVSLKEFVLLRVKIGSIWINMQRDLQHCFLFSGLCTISIQ